MSWWREQKHTPRQAVALAAGVGIVSYYVFGRALAAILAAVVLANELIFQRKPKAAAPPATQADGGDDTP